MQEEAANSAKPSALRYIFFGTDGLRAGWTLLLWLLLVALIGNFVNALMRHFAPRTPGAPTREWVSLITSWLFFLITGSAGWIVSRVERRPWSAYYIGSIRGRASQFATGIFWGFATLSALILLLWRTGYIAFGGFNLHGAAIPLWAGIVFASFIGTGLFEEFVFRGFLQFTLTRGISGILRSSGATERPGTVAFWITAILLAIIFGAIHGSNPGEGRIGLISAGIIGFCFAISLWRTGSLWWAIGFHTAWDWAESYFYGTPDSGLQLPHRLLLTAPRGNAFYSGGTIGPEGSIFVFAAIALTLLLIHLTMRPQPGSPSTADRAI